ncbi:MAG: substrate-binding domain-containing protein [Planctomycetes bacterium]|nr:substrate-binding domain-containing protein [Planctomycetota bacterium]
MPQDEKNIRRGRPVDQEARFRRVADHLRERIASGDWPAGKAIPSHRQLGKLFNEGQRTIRLAIELLKEEGHLAGNARRRLIATSSPKDGTRVSNGILLEAYTINLWYMGRAGVTADLHWGIQRGAGKLNLALAVAHGEYLRKQVPRSFLGLPLRGILVHGPLFDEGIARYERLNVPVVLVDRPPEKHRVHAACYGNEAGAEMSVERLFALGHRRIAFVRKIQLATNAVESDSRERQEAFLQAMRARGLPVKPTPVYSHMSAVRVKLNALQQMLAVRPAFTAVVTADPNTARAVINAARTAGLAVPRDLSVVSFQGKTDAELNLAGPAVDFVELGFRAAMLLEKPPSEPAVVRIQPAWHGGNTIGPPRR